MAALCMKSQQISRGKWARKTVQILELCSVALWLLHITSNWSSTYVPSCLHTYLYIHVCIHTVQHSIVY